MAKSFGWKNFDIRHKPIDGLAHSADALRQCLASDWGGGERQHLAGANGLSLARVGTHPQAAAAHR